MTTTHDYDTVEVRAEALTNHHVLVGQSGGLSAVYDAHPCKSDFMRDWVEVQTEHGIIYFVKTDQVTVLADYCDHGPSDYDSY